MISHTSGMIQQRRAAWCKALERVESNGLALCPRFAEVAARWNAWWRFEADRPLILTQSGTRSDIRWDKAFDLLDRPADWLKVRRAQVEATVVAGDALPSVRADIGPVSMAAFLGAPLHIGHHEQTTWQEPIITSWDDPPSLTLDAGNHWLEIVLRLLRVTAEDAAGRYLVCLPDLTGAMDVLANLRSPQALCMDLYEHRDAVRTAAARCVDAWEVAYAAMYDAVSSAGAGVVQWVTCWSDTPYTVPTCDFNALIGPDDFTDMCLPSLEAQARRAGRCIFHLDGPDAARHAPALAASTITAIQYTPGAGTPSALAMLDMYRMLQAHDKALFIEAPAQEVLELCEQLDPRGTAIRAGVGSPEEANELAAAVARRFT